MAKTRRAYTGSSVSTTTSSTIAVSSTSSFTVNIATNWPYGADPFYVVVEPGTASEEKILVTRTNIGDTTLTVTARGADGTTGVEHASGSTVYPVFTAVDADEANELTSMWEAKGDLVSYGTATFARLAVGSDDYVLMADSSAGSGLSWGLVDTANIAADAVTAAKIAAGAVDSAELASGAVTEAKLAAALVQKLVPAGTVAATIRSSADSGWLLLDGSTVASADSSYPALWAVAPMSWKSGTSLVLPNMADRVLSGSGATTLGAVGGANTVTIGTANLPIHTHSLNNHTHSLSNHTHSVTHDHGSQTFTVSGTVGSNTTKFLYNTENYGSTPYRAIDINYDTTTFGMAVANVASHDHTWSGSVAVDLSSNTVTSDGPSTANTGQSSGDTGNGGFANTALNVRDAHLAVRFQIKAH